MIHSGLVSITFRNLTPLEIVRLVTAAQLDGIEWGGDVHVPPCDLDNARAVGRMTSDAGLTVAAYGSYYRVGQPDAGSFSDIVDTAVALGAPTIRVWAGTQCSTDIDVAQRAHVIAESRRIADIAATAGLTVSYEYHGRTLIDTNASAQSILREVNHPAIRTYWQPPVDGSREYCAEGLAAILNWLSHVHVFHWQPGTQRHLFSEGTDAWRQYIDLVKRAPGDRYALIESVKDDLPEHLLHDAATLNTWLKGRREVRISLSDGATLFIDECVQHQFKPIAVSPCD